MTARAGSWLALVVVGFALVACGDDGDEADDSGDAGLANPASVYCVEQGGTLEIVADADGNESGICHLADGTEIEEWEYYRQSIGAGSGAGLANPAAVFCAERDGVVSGPEPMCELPDGTVVDAWEYFRAESDAGQ